MRNKIPGHKRLIPAQSTDTVGATSKVDRPERRNSTSYWAFSSLAPVVLLAAIGLAGCRQAHSQDDPRTLPPMVELATVRSSDASRRAFTGVVVARVQSNLGFRVGGEIIERMVDTGAFVRRGQKLMRIDRNDLAWQSPRTMPLWHQPRRARFRLPQMKLVMPPYSGPE